MSDAATVAVYALTRAEIDEIAEAAAKRAIATASIAQRGELTTAEAAEYCGFASSQPQAMDTFRRWAKRKHIARISRGRWRRSALDRAMGGKAA